MSNMTFKQAKEILRDHQNWRRSEGKYKDPLLRPKHSATEVGQAIDTALRALALCEGEKEER